jgi:putative hydrolase of the HAD superfamily
LKKFFDLIAFDADDTLWHNEWVYYEAKKKLINLLSPSFDPEEIERTLNEIEINNIKYYGYGIKSFGLSLIETAVAVTEGHISGEEIGKTIKFIKEMLEAEVRLFENAREVLKSLSKTFNLMLITKGEFIEQNPKISRSGLAEYFRYIEIVSEKSNQTYQNILNKFNLTPDRFLMVGNSLRSDIIPVLEIGGQAVYIPYEDTWFHENQIEPDLEPGFYHEIDDLSQLPGLISKISRNQ